MRATPFAKLVQLSSDTYSEGGPCSGGGVLLRGFTLLQFNFTAYILKNLIIE